MNGALPWYLVTRIHAKYGSRGDAESDRESNRQEAIQHGANSSFSVTNPPRLRDSALTENRVLPQALRADKGQCPQDRNDHIVPKDQLDQSFFRNKRNYCVARSKGSAVPNPTAISQDHQGHQYQRDTARHQQQTGHPSTKHALPDRPTSSSTPHNAAARTKLAA